MVAMVLAMALPPREMGSGAGHRLAQLGPLNDFADRSGHLRTLERVHQGDRECVSDLGGVRPGRWRDGRQWPAEIGHA